MTASPAPPSAPPQPRLLICGFGPFPGFPDNPASGVIDRLSASGWAPDGVLTVYQLIPTTWQGGVEAAAGAARAFGPDSVLVLGVAGGADSFRVEMQAHNCAGHHRPDAAGALHPGPRISAAGPDMVAATAPVHTMVEAIARQGLPVVASPDAGDYLCNYVFYRLLTEAAAPSTGFLHLPPHLPLDDLVRGVRAAAAALGHGLHPAAAGGLAAGP